MTKKSAYHHVDEGEWMRPRMTGYYDRCCDCGLVHIIDYRIVSRNGRPGERQWVEYRARRHGRATGGARRHGPALSKKR